MERMEGVESHVGGVLTALTHSGPILVTTMPVQIRTNPGRSRAARHRCRATWKWRDAPATQRSRRAGNTAERCDRRYTEFEIAKISLPIQPLSSATFPDQHTNSWQFNLDCGLSTFRSYCNINQAIFLVTSCHRTETAAVAFIVPKIGLVITATSIFSQIRARTAIRDTQILNHDTVYLSPRHQPKAAHINRQAATPSIFA